MKRRPRKPGRQCDTYDRLNKPIPDDKKDTSLIDRMPSEFWQRLAEMNAKKGDERGQ